MWKFGIGTRKWTLEVSKVIYPDPRIKHSCLTLGYFRIKKI